MSGNQDMLVATLKRMYESYGLTDKNGMAYFSDYISSLEKYDFGEVLKIQMSNYPPQYVLDFLLASPDLWSGFSSDEWLKILKSTLPRPDSLKWVDDLGFYADIQFLCKYLGLNAIDSFVEQRDISEEDKINTLMYFRKSSAFLIADEIDLEDLDGEYFVDICAVNNIKNRILAEGKISEFKFSSQEEIINHIDEIKEKLAA